MKRRANTIFVNSISTYARMGLGMVLTLLTTRTTLDVLAENHQTAKEIFGIFMLLTSIAATVQFLNESTQQALVRFLAISIHEQDYQQSKQLFNSGWLMNAVIGSSMAAVLVVLSPWIVSSFNIPQGLHAQANGVIWVLALGQVSNSMTQAWGAGLIAEDRYVLGNILGFTQQVLILIGTILLRFFPVNPLIGLSLAWIVPPVVIGALLAVWLAVNNPHLRLDWHSVRWKDCKQLFSLGGWSSLISFTSSLYERTDQIIINIFLGPVFNAAYAVVIQMGNAVSRLVTAMTSVLLPTASRIAATGSLWEKQQLIIRTTRYVLTLAVPCAVGMTIFRQEIIELWLGKGFKEAVDILPLTIFLVFCRIPILVTWPYLTATNQLKLPALTMLLDGVINVVLSVLYVKVFDLGLAGVVLGTLSTNLIRFGFFQIPFVAKLIELPVSQYWKKGYGLPAISMLWLTPTLFLIHWFKLPGAPTISLLILTALAYAVWTWLRIFDEYERKLFLDIFNRISRKNRVQDN